MIKRLLLSSLIRAALRRSRAVALLGPRQSGKTTLARTFLPEGAPGYFDLEDPESSARLSEPMTTLKRLRGLIVIDEIQRRPDLFPILRVLCDRKPSPAKFLLLGSAAPALIRHASETLAGRVETIEVGGFTLAEAGIGKQAPYWLRGGFPPSFLARTDADSFAWRKAYIQTILERDVPQLGFSIPSTALGRFWSMLAHYHGQIWNAAEPARALGIGESTVRRYLDLMEGLFMVRQLQPWHANLKKRQVKAPKIYLRDTGLLHQLLGIRSLVELEGHPKCGASWEGYALTQALDRLQPDEAYFWATHEGAELDLLAIKGGRRFGIECKRTDAPRLTPSMRIAMRDLALHRLWVLHPGEHRYPLAERIEAIPLSVVVRSGF